MKVDQKIDCEHAANYFLADKNTGRMICTACYPPAVIYKTPISNPSDRQIGGDHYRKFKIQPIEYVLANGMGYLPGCALKYITRYKDKGGAQDIHKAIHYLQLILEFEYGEKKHD